MTKITTNSTKHHKYVTVNKKERKKIKIIANKYPLVEHWAKCLNFIHNYYIYIFNYGYGYIINNKHSKNLYRILRDGFGSIGFIKLYKYQQASHILVWNDCNHQSCRIIIKNKNHNTSKFIVKIPYECYINQPKVFTKQQLIN